MSKRLGVLVAVPLLISGCGVLDRLHPASLTFRVDHMVCAPSAVAGTIGTVCSFSAYYGNVSSHAVQVVPGTTTVLDRTGRHFAPVADASTKSAYLLAPGHQQPVAWSVTLPVNARPAKVQWHGSNVSVLLDVSSGTPQPSAVPSASPSASASAAVSAPAATTPAPTTPAPTPTTAVPTTPAPTSAVVVKPTKTEAKPKPTRAKPKPTTPKPTTPATTTPPPTTPPPPVTTTTHRPPVVHHTVPPTTNSTNPGGGSGGIG